MRFRFIEEHRASFPPNRLCDVVGVSARGLRAFRSRPASPRQRSDLVMLAHIKEQSRLSLGSYGRPRMTEELKEIGLDVGHRRVGADCCARMVYLSSEPANTRSPQTAITSSTLRRTCWIVTSPPTRLTRNGPVTSAMFGPKRAGFILQ